jgi:hypothetical protein
MYLIDGIKLNVKTKENKVIGCKPISLIAVHIHWLIKN